MAFAAGYRLATCGWLAGDDTDLAVQTQPAIIILPTDTPATTPTPDVSRRPVTSVIVPDPTSTPTAIANPDPTPIRTPTLEPTVTSVPTATPNPVNGRVGSTVLARAIDADQLPIHPTNEFTVGDNIFVATEFRDVPAGSILGIAWYRDGVEVDV